MAHHKLSVKNRRFFSLLLASKFSLKFSSSMN